MNTPEEKRAYARGYQAGRKTVKKNRTASQLYNSQMAFRDRAFLAALPFAMQQTTWKQGETPIESLEARIKLAWTVANHALKQREII